MSKTRNNGRKVAVQAGVEGQPTDGVVAEGASKLDRRAFLRLGAGAVAALPLAATIAACGDDDDDDATDTDDDTGADTGDDATDTGNAAPGNDDDAAPGNDDDDVTSGETGGETGDETGGETGDETSGETGGETSGETGGETSGETGGEIDLPEGVHPISKRWPQVPEGATSQRITFVHVNDIHANFFPLPNAESPASRVVGYYKKVKAENPWTIFTNGTDDYEKGSVGEVFSKGAMVRELSHAMKFDLKTVGNHDFAWGAEEFLAYTRDPYALVLCENVDYTGAKPEQYGALKYQEIQCGAIRMGVFGMVSGPWNELNERYIGDFLPDFPTSPDEEWPAIVEAVVKKNRANVDLMVMLSHLGYGADKAIAAEVNGIDVILGGHSHTVLGKEDVTNGTIIGQAGSSLAWVARLDLDVDLATKKVTEYAYKLEPVIGLTMPADAEFEAVAKAAFAKHSATAFDAVGYAENALDKRAVMRMTAGACLEMFEVDAAVLDVDSQWGVISAGAVNAQDMYDAYKVELQPAGTSSWNALYSVAMTGATLKAIAAQVGASEDWAVRMPEVVEDGATYRVAMHKGKAFNPQRFFGEARYEGEAKFENEVCVMLIDYAKARTAANKHIDSETALG